MIHASSYIVTNPIRNQLYSLELSTGNEENQRVNKIRVPMLLSIATIGNVIFGALVSYNPRNDTFKDLSFHGIPNWFEPFVHEDDLSRPK
ncbi:hypothetical protein Patl1_01883 [Pistacia atlantica]|uniref:Uncharacterized protein n=1 Tax=Pistacia atlantica TaxID=434234 RepID=A0ACC1C745_9ROSI|nr:hypothetical protein Patl1_01883 [Pistacia atlantica]